MSKGGHTGHFVSWDGGCLFIGSFDGVVPVHAHYAIQIAFGSEPGIRFRGGEDEPWTSYDGAMIPSRQPHSMDTKGLRYNAVLFVEPETREGRVLVERYLQDGITSMPVDAIGNARALMRIWAERPTNKAIVDGAWRVIRALTGQVQPSVVSDERVLRAVAYVNAHIEQPMSLDDVASQAHLSPSRFRHVFVEQIGMGLRPYILWRRFIRVWELLRAGSSLSAAAHQAGFADAAHLTRTARRMFGIPPTALGTWGQVQADDGEQ